MMRLTVEAGSDPFRARRYTRELHTALTEDRDLARSGITVDISVVSGDDEVGAKGTVETIALLATAAATAKPAYESLVTAVRAWLERPDRSAVVTITDGDRSMTLTGDPGPQQQRLITEFLAGSPDDSHR